MVSRWELKFAAVRSICPAQTPLFFGSQCVGAFAMGYNGKGFDPLTYKVSYAASSHLAVLYRDSQGQDYCACGPGGEVVCKAPGHRVTIRPENNHYYQ